MNKLHDIVLALDVVPFEPNSGGQFSALSDIPDWFNAVFQANNNSEASTNSAKQYDLATAFAFVDHFLFDAKILWDKSEDDICKSGIWTEEVDNEEYMLEAIAVKRGGNCYLLLSNLTSSFSQRQQVFQNAREIALTNEKLIVELNHRQRSLQTLIESHLRHEASLTEISESVGSDSTAVMICKPDGSVEVLNKALIDIYKFDSAHSSRQESLLESWIKEAEATYPEIKRVVSSGVRWEGEFETYDVSGKSKWIRLAIGPVKNDDKEITHYVCVANDLSDYLKIENTADGNVNEYDFTTQLPNRRYFWRKINDHIKSGDVFTLLYIDIDYFKSVNEKIGHEAGDQLLAVMATRISRGVKKNDFVAHLGGDEFVMILCEDGLSNNIAMICDRLLNNIRDPLLLNGSTVSVSASIGYAERRDGESASDVLKHADIAMYAAKELGRNHSRSYSHDLELDQRLNAFHHREYEIRSAIAQEEFELFYQPQVCMTADKYFRVEALARWHHPKRGLVSPIDFIPIAESSGLIVPLGTWVLQSACQHGYELLSMGVPVKMAVNISAKQLKHPSFFSVLTKIIDKTDFPADYLELEITESCFLDDMNNVISLLRSISAMGIAISLDDFGSGFSSLNYLQRLPVDYLKIDSSFVQELPTNRESQIITSSVISLAHTLDKKVIAEGVETQEQLDFLNQHHCDFIQGFLFYRPMPFDQLIDAYQEVKRS